MISIYFIFAVHPDFSLNERLRSLSLTYRQKCNVSIVKKCIFHFLSVAIALRRALNHKVTVNHKDTNVK